MSNLDWGSLVPEVRIVVDTFARSSLARKSERLVWGNWIDLRSRQDGVSG
jgi:hypothetical protein